MKKNSLSIHSGSSAIYFYCGIEKDGIVLFSRGKSRGWGENANCAEFRYYLAPVEMRDNAMEGRRGEEGGML